MRRREIPTPRRPLRGVTGRVVAFPPAFVAWAQQRTGGRAAAFLAEAADIAEELRSWRELRAADAQSAEQQRAAIALVLELVERAVSEHAASNLQVITSIGLALRIMCGRARPLHAQLDPICSGLFESLGIEPGELMRVDAQVFTALLHEPPALYESFLHPERSTSQDLSTIRQCIAARLKAIEGGTVRLPWWRADGVHVGTVRRVAALLHACGLPVTEWQSDSYGKSSALITTLEAILGAAGATAGRKGAARHWLCKSECRAAIASLRSTRALSHALRSGIRRRARDA